MCERYLRVVALQRPVSPDAIDLDEALPGVIRSMRASLAAGDGYTPPDPKPA